MAKAKKKRLPKDFEELLEQGDLAALQAVFDTCDVNARVGYAKCTALAFDTCPDELARWLVANGADLEATDTWKNTALHTRARSWRGRIEVLLELGANVHAMTSLGTPLHAAADGARAQNAKLLLAAGADVNAPNPDKVTPLELALQRAHNAHLPELVALARALLDAGATKTPSMKDAVSRIGTTFEFHRSGFNNERLPASSAALDELYVMFDVAPVPRRVIHDGATPIVIGATTWQKAHAELWDLLVPSSGPASTSQGEVIRIAGKLADEIHRNGGINWSDDHRGMAHTFHALVQRGTPLDDATLHELKTLVAALARNGECNVDRLAELAVAWVRANPRPIELGDVAYKR
jgi:ankyrin repeat protein